MRKVAVFNPVLGMAKQKLRKVKSPKVSSPTRNPARTQSQVFLSLTLILLSLTSADLVRPGFSLFNEYLILEDFLTPDTI